MLSDATLTEMESHAFIAEVYRRMSARHPNSKREGWDEIRNSSIVEQSVYHYAPLLPRDKRAAILDVGFGSGWFIAACLKLGYTNLSGADFGIAKKANVAGCSPHATLHEIQSNIGDFLAGHKEEFDFIHMSHVIEHIPKYSLFYVVDSLYWALKPGGTLLLRTPNMEGPCPNSTFYVTLAHEYGFTGSNLDSLLDLCNFEDRKFHEFGIYRPTIKQRTGHVLRQVFVWWSSLQHRLFGANYGKQYGSEVVITGKRGTLPALFDQKYR